MTQLIDRASELEQYYRELALAEHQAKQTPLHSSRSHCKDCNEAIPKARQQAISGCQYCLECQQWREKHE